MVMEHAVSLLSVQKGRNQGKANLFPKIVVLKSDVRRSGQIVYITSLVAN